LASEGKHRTDAGFVISRLLQVDGSIPSPTAASPDNRNNPAQAGSRTKEAHEVLSSAGDSQLINFTLAADGRPLNSHLPPCFQALSAILRS